MPIAVYTFAAILLCVFYLAVSGLLWVRATMTAGGDTNLPLTVTAFTGARTIRMLIAGLAVLHGWHVWLALTADGAINLALGLAVSLVAWMGVALLWAASLAQPTLSLGLIVLPLGLLGFVVGWLLPGEPWLLADLPRGVGRHITIAIPAYGVLNIAFAQALILSVQERQLRKPNPGGFFPALPALETMEAVLFQLTWIGFILLTANLITGMLTTREHYGALLLFNHHILLALLAWGGFGALLAGRKLFGWRGRVAANCTMLAFVVLALAYFGTRFVGGVILQSAG